MGIDPEIEYGGDCIVCWPANLTPKYLYVAFTGIVVGALWNPWEPPPPNGIWKIEQFVGCVWNILIAPYIISYGTSLPGSGITAHVLGPGDAFTFFDPADCVFKGPNGIAQPPNRKYYGGTAQVSWKG